MYVVKVARTDLTLVQFGFIVLYEINQPNLTKFVSLARLFDNLDLQTQLYVLESTYGVQTE